MLKRLGIIAATVFMAGAAFAAEHEVKMVNTGETGTMAFEPGFVKAAPGDTIRFVAVDQGHNVESIKGMLPDGVERFRSKPGEEYVLTLTVPGLYGVKCSPHFAMGMILLIQVGDKPANLDIAKAVKLPKKASERMQMALAALSP